MSFLKRLVDLLAPLGFLIATGALAWTRYGKTLPGGLRPYLIAALALVLLHLVLRWEDVAGGLGRRQLKYGTNTFVLVLVTPWVAYITSVVLWLDGGNPTIYFMVAFTAFPVFTFGIVGGMKSADPAARELLASVDARPWYPMGIQG